MVIVGHRHRQDGAGDPAALRADARPEVRDLDGLAAPTAAAPTGTATRSPRASTRSSRSTSTCPAARRGPRRCSKASCCSRSASGNEDMAERWKGDPSSSEPTHDRRTDGRRGARGRDRRAAARRCSPTSPSELGDAVVGSHIRARATTSGCGSTREAWPRPPRSRATSAGLHVLRLPVGHRLAAVALRALHGLRGRHARPAGMPRRSPSRSSPATPAATRASRCSPGLNSTLGQRGITLKADVPDDDLSHRHLDARSTPAPTGTSARPGRCSASTFDGPSPTCATSTCRRDFEGHPLRKDFPLLARRVKPWPGIVDVEPMPGGDDEDPSRGGRRRMTATHRTAQTAGVRQRPRPPTRASTSSSRPRA